MSSSTSSFVTGGTGGDTSGCIGLMLFLPAASRELAVHSFCYVAKSLQVMVCRAPVGGKATGTPLGVAEDAARCFRDSRQRALRARAMVPRPLPYFRFPLFSHFLSFFVTFISFFCCTLFSSSILETNNQSTSTLGHFISDLSSLTFRCSLFHFFHLRFSKQKLIHLHYRPPT